MNISEKAAYLKGLMDGLDLDADKPETKVIKALVELVGDMSRKLTDIEDTTIAISDELDEIEEDLDAIEDYILDEDEDEDDWDEDEDWDEDDCWDEDEDFEEGFEYGDEDSIIYEVKCVCGNVINFDEETLEKGSIICDKCGETLEFSVDDVEEEDEEIPF